ncbi:hypothetical protein Tco_0140779 [Tanacetum coccineum]
MASGGSDRNAKDALSKLLQIGTVVEYESKFVILANRVNPTTLGETFSLAHATEARFAKDALSKLLQMGTVTEYQNEFEMLIKRVTGISEFLLKSFYISRLKPALQIELLRARPTTLVEAFSLACMTEARFEDERTTTTIVNPNDLNIAIPDQVLEESILHTLDKVEITSNNDAQNQASEVKTKVLVDVRMGAWRRGVVVGRSSVTRRKKKAAAFALFNRNENRKSMERKLRQLQRIIPGGRVEPSDLDTLFHRVAAHIFILESRVDVLKNAYSLFSLP